MNPTHSWGSYSMMYRNDFGNINLSLKNYSYTSFFAAWSKRNVCKSRIGSYSLIFRNDFGVFIWLQHNTLYGLIDSECMHIPCHFMDKTGNPLIIKCKISTSVNHMWQNISLRATKGDLYHNMMKFLQQCSSHIAKWLPHTHVLLASSHVIWHISAGYRRGVISKYG